MTVRRSDYVVVPLKVLNAIGYEIATTKEYAKKKAVSFANIKNEVMLVRRLPCQPKKGKKYVT
jgi:hypothetical protein